MLGRHGSALGGCTGMVSCTVESAERRGQGEEVLKSMVCCAAQACNGVRGEVVRGCVPMWCQHDEDVGPEGLGAGEVEEERGPKGGIAVIVAVVVEGCCCC